MTARFVCLPHPIGPELEAALDRLERTGDVARVAVMPDAHVADDVCVGTVTATRRTLIPAAVGADIGCGMSAIALDADADLLADRDRAARLLAALYARVPRHAHPAATAPPLPPDLLDAPLGAPSLEAMKRREGRLEHGTLGRGNHFLEVQRDEQGGLWLLCHSGSRAMGPAIRAHHERRARASPGGLAVTEADAEEGRAYLDGVGWARRYAATSRARMLDEAIACFGELFAVEARAESRFDVDHDHVRLERHEGEDLWVHRKGAMGLDAGAPGVVPGSMGTASFHVEGRGHAPSLRSSAHGAGRALSRSEARRRIPARALVREVGAVWFDHRLAADLREEAPSAYKDVAAVMRAQRDLVRVVRTLRPVLSFKGT